MSIWEGLVAAKAELMSIPRPRDRFRRFLEIGRILVEEIAASAAMIPFGARALRTYFSVQPVEAFLKARTGATRVERLGDVAVVRGVRYGPQERNLMDIYVPVANLAALEAPQDLWSLIKDPYPLAPTAAADSAALAKPSPPSDPTSAAASSSSAAPSPSPVALFVHGGVWATGDRWHYAPMASRLAQAGCVAVVMSYSLFPKALVPAMVEEVAQALDWVGQHSGRLRADPRNLSLVGHSAGAQLCAMVLLQRAKDLAAKGVKKQGPTPYMPKRAVLVSGVYDIERHFEYEDARGVATLSTMRPAVGGHEAFAGQSPAVILAEAVKATGGSGGGAKDGKKGAAAAGLHGEVMASWTGFIQASADHTGLLRPSDLHVTADEASRLPTTYLLHSFSDITVPWYESADYHLRLQEVGCDSKLLLYNKVGHGDFVTGWWPRASGARAAAAAASPSAPDLSDPPRPASATAAAAAAAYHSTAPSEPGSGSKEANDAARGGYEARKSAVRAAIRGKGAPAAGGGAARATKGPVVSPLDHDLPAPSQDILALLRGLD